MGCVYMATCRTTVLSYIGKTTRTLARRKIQHRCTAKKSKLYFHCALRKYGEDSFDWKELFTSNSEEELSAEEIKNIAIYNTLAPNGYNLTLGGEGTAGTTFSEEWHIRKKQQMTERMGKRVFCLENDTIYRTISEAALDLHLCAMTVSQIASRKSHRTIGKYHFCHANEIDIMELKAMSQDGSLYEITPTAHFGLDNSVCRAVVNLDDGNIFPMIKDALAFYGLNPKVAAACISQCCSGRTKTSYGYRWKYVSEKNTKRMDLAPSF